MKTNRSARNIVRIRLVVACLLFIGITAVAFRAGELMGKQSARASTPQIENLDARKVDLGTLFASD